MLYLAVAARGAFPGQVAGKSGGRPRTVTPHVRTDAAVVKLIRDLQCELPTNLYLRQGSQFAVRYYKKVFFTSMEKHILAVHLLLNNVTRC